MVIIVNPQTSGADCLNTAESPKLRIHWTRSGNGHQLQSVRHKAIIGASLSRTVNCTLKVAACKILLLRTTLEPDSRRQQQAECEGKVDEEKAVVY